MSNEDTKSNGEQPAKRFPPDASPVNGMVPPPEHRFSSTNQPKNSGRKKGCPNIKTVFEKLLTQPVSKKTRGAIQHALGGDQKLPESVDYLTAIALGQINKAISKRDTRSAELVFDRVWGKPQQRIINEEPIDDPRDIELDFLTEDELDAAEKAMSILEGLRVKANRRKEEEAEKATEEAAKKKAESGEPAEEVDTE